MWRCVYYNRPKFNFNFNFILPKVNTDYIGQAQAMDIDNLRLINTYEILMKT